MIPQVPQVPLVPVVPLVPQVPVVPQVPLVPQVPREGGGESYKNVPVFCSVYTALNVLS